MRVKSKSGNLFDSSKVISEEIICTIPKEVIQNTPDEEPVLATNFSDKTTDKNKIYVIEYKNKKYIPDYYNEDYFYVTYSEEFEVYFEHGYDIDENWTKDISKSRLSFIISDREEPTDMVVKALIIKNIDNYLLGKNLVVNNSISIVRKGEIGEFSSALGYYVEASGYNSHAEGNETTASGEYSHAEGDRTTASGDYSHAEGYNTTASGWYSHAEGYITTASGSSSHTEGYNTTASGSSSHAEGDRTTASGSNSHAEGERTIASGSCSHVQGKFNIKDTANKYAHIVGNGTRDTSRSNAHTLDWNGNGWYKGKLSQDGVPTEDNDLTTKKYVDDKFNTSKGVIYFDFEYDTNFFRNEENQVAYSSTDVTSMTTTYVDIVSKLEEGYEVIARAKKVSTIPNSTFIDYEYFYLTKKAHPILLFDNLNAYSYRLQLSISNSISNVEFIATSFDDITENFITKDNLSFNEAGELVVTIDGVSKVFVAKS